MKIISKAGFTSSILFILLLGFIMVPSRGEVAKAIGTNNWYTYQPSTNPTFSVDLTTSSGVKQTFTFPTQNPPSILQPMTFPQIDSTAGMIVFDDNTIEQSLIVGPNGSKLLYPNSPYPAHSWFTQFVTPQNMSAWLADTYSFRISPLPYFFGNIPSSIANEDTVIGFVDANKELALRITNYNSTVTLAKDVYVDATSWQKLSGTSGGGIEIGRAS